MVLSVQHSPDCSPGTVTSGQMSPHTWKHSLSEDRIASTAATQQFLSLGNTGMLCSLGSEWGENEGRGKETDNTNSHSQRLILHFSLTH